MTTKTPPTPEQPEPNESFPWGIAHNRRGLKYHEIAKQFIDEYPIGTVFLGGIEGGYDLVEIGRELFGCPEEAYRAPSYYARRLTISGTHPRMGKDVFSVVLTPEGIYRVEEPLKAWQICDMTDVIEKKIASLKRFYDYKLQGKEMSDLPRSLQKSLRRAYREQQRLQEVNAALHGPMIEALEDLAAELEDYKG